MANLTFEQLEPIKLPLVQRFYKQYYPSAKPKRDEEIFVAKVDNIICAAVRYRNIDGFNLLTGLAVAHEHRLKGIGHQLCLHSLPLVRNPKIYCFAFEDLESYYQKIGFETCDSSSLPAPLKGPFERYTQSGKQLIAMQYLD